MTDTFLALRRDAFAVSAMPDGDDRNEAAYQLARQIIGPQSQWADTDPAAAERWLVSRGASVDQALAGAGEFEWATRALFALEYQHDAPTFEALAAYLDRIHPGKAVA